jgi:CelD/BcsL family acetyltransferase involved in cellulose biosynthesis
VTGGDGLESAVRAYEKIYNSSWKTPEPFPKFMPGLLRAFAKEGWLRLGVAYVDEEPAAAQVWFLANGVASIYKIAYDQKFKDLSVGSFLTMHMIRAAIDAEKVQEIDYLTGDDQYKRDWMSQRRERWGILAMNPRTPKGAAAIVRHVAGRFAKRAIQRLLKNVRPEKAQKAKTPPAKSGVNSPRED